MPCKPRLTSIASPYMPSLPSFASLLLCFCRGLLERSYPQDFSPWLRAGRLRRFLECGTGVSREVAKSGRGTAKFSPEVANPAHFATHPAGFSVLEPVRTESPGKLAESCGPRVAKLPPGTES